MTKIKIAAVVLCMLAGGAFAGFTYQAANHSDVAEERGTVRTVSDDEYVTDDEVLTDDETTSDETITDEETTDEEMTAEETVIALTEPAEDEKKPETEKSEDKAEGCKVLKKQQAAPIMITTAPVAEEVPETVNEKQTTTTSAVKETAPVETTPAPAETTIEVKAEPVIETEAVAETEKVIETAPVETEAVTEAEVPVVTEAVEETPAAEVKLPEETVKAEETPAVVEEEVPAEESEEVPAEEPAEEESARKIEVTDEEYIWLCNVVGHEYGSDWISIEEKAKVVEVIMNRVNDPRFPDTIWDVLTQPNQFSGLEWTLYLGDFSYQVTDSVKDAVDLYLEHPEQFDDGYLAFWGDGSANHFYSV